MRQALTTLLEERKAAGPQDDKGKQNLQEIVQLLHEIDVAVGEGISPDDAKEAIKWWQNANLQKNTGLYVACNNSQWLSPQQVSKSKFIRGEKYTAILIREAAYFARILDDTRNQDLLALLKPDIQSVIS